MGLNNIRVNHIFALFVLAAVMGLAACTQAKPLSPINAGSDGIALKGYDPVAYFTEDMPVKGSKQFSYEWNGATWLFSSKEHMDMFQKEPEKYAPQYGGY